MCPYLILIQYISATSPASIHLVKSPIRLESPTAGDSAYTVQSESPGHETRSPPSLFIRKKGGNLFGLGCQVSSFDPPTQNKIIMT